MTLALLEALASKFQKLGLQSLTIQSDNASCYTSKIVNVAMSGIFNTYGITLKGYIHSESCCGKTQLDGHFGCVGRRLRSYITATGRTVGTAHQIHDAISYSGGLKNTEVMVVRLHDSNLADLKERYVRMHVRI